MGLQQCGLEFRERVGVVASLRVRSHSLFDAVVAGQQRSTPTGRQQLAAAERQYRHLTPGSGHTPGDPGSGHLAGVLDDRHATSVGQVAQRRHVDLPAVEMRDEHRSRRGCHRLFDPIDIQVPVLRADVDQNRGGPDTQHVLHVSTEVVGSQDHLVAGSDLQAPQGQFDGNRTAGTQPHVIEAVKSGERFGECFGVWSVVVAPTAVGGCPLQDLDNCRVVGWPAGRTLGSDGRTAQDGREIVVGHLRLSRRAGLVRRRRNPLRWLVRAACWFVAVCG